MAHPRKLIRAAVVAALTGATDADTRVESTRVEPIKTLKLPALAVYTSTEETDPGDDTTAPRELWRDATVKVAGWVSAGTAPLVADAMDDLAEQIEAAMDVDRYFGGLAGDSILTATDLELVETGDPLIGQVVLTYQVTYRTDLVAPANLNDYLRTGVTTQIDGAGADNVVSDLFDQQ